MTKISITLVMVLFALPALAFADGKTDFDANCARCHGGDARTITKRSNILKIDPTKLALRASEMNEAEMIAIIEKGKNLMPGFENELTKDQIRAVVEYIRAQKK
jgi:mono/diheme cytochrome c family protein